MTNTLDGTVFAVEFTREGKPLCPYCGEPMERVGDNWENCLCQCWGVGAETGDCPRQIVLPCQD